jgi:hypothetical protein
MPRRLLVTSNCQTGGIAAALRACFPEDEVTAQPFSPPDDIAAQARLAEALAQADAWIAPLKTIPWLREAPFTAHMAGKTVVQLPLLNFAAFHPDLAYVLDLRSGSWLKPDYQSRLVVRAWQLGVQRSMVPLLFTGKVMQALGYCSGWAQGMADLQAQFANSSLDFASFYLRVKRLGTFMHSHNHPRVEVTTIIGLMAAVCLGASPAQLTQPLLLPDPLLENIVWPVYPPVGQALGVPGSYRWSFNLHHHDLQSYIDLAYANLEASGARPEDLTWAHPDRGPPEDLLDSVLREALRAG